jgi:hypothetical protein
MYTVRKPEALVHNLEDTRVHTGREGLMKYQEALGKKQEGESGKRCHEESQM